MKTESSKDTEIPELPGHCRRTMWYFLRSWLGMLVGMGIFGLGLYWVSSAMQIAGGCIAAASFIWMLTTISKAQTARCPTCSREMTQGWDAQRQETNGVFTCSKCGKYWSTKATWGFD